MPHAVENGKKVELRTAELLHALYEEDETAWLEAMAELIGQRRLHDLDLEHLREYLSDMAKRDRREVQSRLATLIAHLLKWEYQSKKRTGSWRATIIEQRDELEGLLESGVLRNHAAAVLPQTYAKGVARAAAETGLPTSTFPEDCPYLLEQLMSAAGIEM